MKRKPLPVLFLLIFAVGCGQKTGTVSGTVLWEGKPVENGVIEFVPLDDKTIPATPAQIIDGKYQATVPLGRMQVQLTCYADEGSYYPSGPAGPKIKPLRNVIPPEWNVESKLEYTVLKGEQKYDYPKK